MKRIIFTLCLFLALAISVNAEELYTCIDSNGNSIVTDSPQDGMKNCVLKDSSIKSSPKEQENDKDKAVVKKDNDGAKAKDTPEARNARIKKCLDCCQNKVQACYNYTADSRLCGAEMQNCVDTCNSKGSSSSSWSDCWPLSDN